MAFHTRSVSLPTNSHSFVLKAEAQLYKLKSSVTSSSFSFQKILDAPEVIRNTYECINDILYMSSNQNNLYQLQQRRFINQEMEESINLLDICSTSRDSLGEIKCNLQDLKLALNKSRFDTVKSKRRDYIHLVKKSTKDVKKHVFGKSEPIEDKVSAAFGLLMDAREITISLFQSIFSYLSKQLVGQKTSKWSLVSRALQKRINEYKEDEENAFDIASLRTMFLNVEELENGLECLFRHMIQCRVSLLNNYSS
ncbi:hypothetical protein LUZ60_011962 [Juncus effusus]|nr:hypothetical protein LUZ60_011962 [Juncus effusus]